MHDGGTTSTMSIDPQQMADVTARFFEGANESRLAERLVLAQTVVHIHFTDNVGVTLDLTKTPITAEPEIVGSSEVQMYGTPEIFLEIIRREKQMAMAITRGEVAYEGPVRKFLRIVPILRSLDFTVWKELTGDQKESAAPPPPWSPEG